MIALALFLAATPATAKPAKPCPPTAPIAVRDARKHSPRVRPLSEMPPARQEIAVQRTVDGCVVPMVVRENVGR